MKYSLFILLGLLAACNNGNNNVNNNSDTIKNNDTDTTGSADAFQCYESIYNKDTVFLSLFQQPEVITGSLIYNYYEKDKNMGTINGNMHGDTLIAEYVYNSEGATSIRDVVFLKQGSDFIEGYGEMKQEGDKMVFKNMKTLNFTGKPLKKIDCGASAEKN